MTRKASRGVLGVSAILMSTLTWVVAFAPPASAELTTEECQALVEEGEQAREDLAKLIESQGSGAGDTTSTTSAEIGTYVQELLESAAINVLGFVSADAGAPLDVCLPKGTTTLTMFSDPVVLWEGLATTDFYPVTVVIPADAECGTHDMTATGGETTTVQFTVGGDCVDPDSGGALPRTGAEIGMTVGIGVALLAVGWAVLRGRRRHTISNTG